ncbi:MAG: hypothetical protein GIKADHBN_03446 [Phycisphaerales bacterium]|nr:hypothetical protein [Phycisphaerales bacterium]
MTPLDQHNHDLLVRFFELGEDFAALAEHTGARLLDLYAWAAHPVIRAYIDFHRDHARYIHDRDARATLHAVATTSTDSLERRRAATTLLRTAPHTRARRPAAPQATPATTHAHASHADASTSVHNADASPRRAPTRAGDPESLHDMDARAIFSPAQASEIISFLRDMARDAPADPGNAPLHDNSGSAHSPPASESPPDPTVPTG